MTTVDPSVRSCSFLASLLGDPLTATALETSGWILVEHPGPWGKNALSESGLDPLVVAEIEARMKATNVRVQLISPPSGREPAACYVAGDPRGDELPWLVELPARDIRDVLDLDFAAIAVGQPPAAGRPSSAPLYAVCANEMSDPCCGSTGRQVHAAAAGILGDRARRTAHVGGHKYAANMVVFPYAFYYGRLDPRSVQEVVRANEAGDVLLDKLRGRSTFTLAEQAAEQFLRRSLGVTQREAITLRQPAESLPGRCHAVGLRSGDWSYRVTVSERNQQPARLQSCTDHAATVPVEWVLDGIEEIGSAAP